MRNFLHKNDLSRAGVALLSGYRRTKKSNALSIFLCGGHMGRTQLARPRFFRAIKDDKNFVVRMPEGLFDDLLEKKTYDLLALEEILAHSVDAIVIFPESPGSFAELGAFLANDVLRRKIICICEESYKSDLSFINVGPVKILKSIGRSRVIYFKYKDLDNRNSTTALTGKIAAQVRAIKKEMGGVEAGLFFLEDLIVHALFCLQSATPDELKLLYSANDIGVETSKMDGIFEICLNTLLTTKKVEKNEHGEFQLARWAVREILQRSTKERLSMLSSLRVEAMNASLRRHAETKSVRM